MHVLTVDFLSPQSPELFCRSLKETGFAVLRNHPIPPELIHNAYQQWQAFFYSEQKYNYLFNRQTQDGYFPLKSENAKDRKISDIKEFFHFYPWGQVPENLKLISQEIYQNLHQLSVRLLCWIEDYLPAELSQALSMPLNNMVDESNNTLLRILHYPALTNDIEEGAIRAAAHEDINLITLLPAATAPGLEVLDANGVWHSVSCDPGNIVVNVGDMLQMCTNGYYKSTSHRVVNPSDEDNQSRFSMPLFLHPRQEVQLSKEYTAVQYLHERLRQIGIY